MLIVVEEVKRPSLFSEDVENVSPSRATKLSIILLVLHFNVVEVEGTEENKDIYGDVEFFA